MARLNPRTIVVGLLGALILTTQAARLSSLEQIPIESYKEMREVERYQLGIAEKYYIQEEYKIALDEYEKFLTLYADSPGAPYAQLMWSHCQAKLRKVNTAIREGFQSVIDYWPQSREAVLAAFLIAKSYQDIGEVDKAKVSYRKLMEDYPDDHLTVLAKVNLLEMAKIEEDQETRLEILEELTYKTPRTEAADEHCRRAARELAGFYFYRANWKEAVKALETSYEGHQLAEQIYEHGRNAVNHLKREEETREQAESLAADLIAMLNDQIPTDLEEGNNRQHAWNHLTRIASIHSQMDRQDDVLKTYERMGKMLGTNDSLRGLIASYYKSIDERDKARATYNQFEDQIAGQRNIAGMFREEGKYKEAIEIYRGLIDQDPDRIDDYLWAVAECYEAAGELKNAIQSYRQVDRFPSNYFRMAQCHRRLKEYNEALTLYNQIKSSESSAAEAFLQIGYTYEQAGQKENAIKAFQLTCRSHPKSGQASRAHAHLQSQYQINVTLGGAKDE